jgi:DNA ligase-1
MTSPLLSRRAFTACLAALSLPGHAFGARAAAAMPLPLALDAPSDVDPAGHLVSEKYDGVRALWDGARLHFRSAAPIVAPAWFTSHLPPSPLDGELWLGRGSFESLSAAVRRKQPDDAEWRAMRYMVFEQPQGSGSFAARARRIELIARQAAWPQLLAAPMETLGSRAALQRRLAEVVQGGGEGLVLHRADAEFEAGRTGAMLKLKPMDDADAVVTGHVAGRGRHVGRLGALRVRTPQGIEFLVGTGLSDAQREKPPSVGSTVTYVYRGTTARGVPRFASFLRVRSV